MRTLLDNLPFIQYNDLIRIPNRFQSMGNHIVGHVHDELIVECGMDVSLDAVCDQMGRTPPWIEGLNLRADGYETMFYKKD